MALATAERIAPVQPGEPVDQALPAVAGSLCLELLQPVVLRGLAMTMRALRPPKQLLARPQPMVPGRASTAMARLASKPTRFQAGYSRRTGGIGQAPVAQLRRTGRAGVGPGAGKRIGAPVEDMALPATEAVLARPAFPFIVQALQFIPQQEFPELARVRGDGSGMRRNVTPPGRLAPLHPSVLRRSQRPAGDQAGTAGRLHPVQGHRHPVHIQQCAAFDNGEGPFAQGANHLVANPGHRLTVEIGLAERFYNRATVVGAITEPDDIHRCPPHSPSGRPTRSAGSPTWLRIAPSAGRSTLPTSLRCAPGQHARRESFPFQPGSRDTGKIVAPGTLQLRAVDNTRRSHEGGGVLAGIRVFLEYEHSFERPGIAHIAGPHRRQQGRNECRSQGSLRTEFPQVE
ncbi:hypothetical protein CLJ1_0993 [Pseudomonas paraeruginosa]|nr:hypothetical protein CLJ1_0993 [Pseudomonas aeruginosa]